MDYTDAELMTGYTNVPLATGPEMSPLAIGIFLIVAVALYIYSAYCLLQIAKKTNTPNEWLAWIPIANIVLMLNVARLSLWWLLGLLIPYVNIGVAVYVWWKIAEERRRPGWWGVLMIISPINLILLYFLAFREAPNQIAPVASSQTPPSAPAA